MAKLKNSPPRIYSFTVYSQKNTYLDLYLSDPSDLITQSKDIRFRLTEAFRQFAALYTNTAYSYLNGMSVTDLRFNFSQKMCSILRLNSMYQTYVGTPSFTVYSAGQNSTNGVY